MNERKETWWSPKGWKIRPATTEYSAAALTNPDNWDKVLAEAGYQPIGPLRMSHHLVLYGLLWQHHSRHLVVEICDTTGCLCWFVVAAKHAAVFLVEKYPALLQTTALAQQLITDLQPKTDLQPEPQPERAARGGAADVVPFGSPT